MNFFHWIKKLTTPPVSTSNLVPAMEGNHAQRCRECSLHFHLSPLGIGQCPRCQSSDFIHIETWLRTPVEQAARVASRRSLRFVKTINGGVPKVLVREIVSPNGDRTTVRPVSNNSSSASDKGTHNG